MSQALPSTLIVLITPPPIWEDKLSEMNALKGKALLLDRTNERYDRLVTSVLSWNKTEFVSNNIDIMSFW